jgi:hypothetical protein
MSEMTDVCGWKWPELTMRLDGWCLKVEMQVLERGILAGRRQKEAGPLMA